MEFGVSSDSLFENAMLSSTKCVVHAFDPTIGNLNTQQKYERSFFYDISGNFDVSAVNIVKKLPERNIKFEKIAISSRSSGGFATAKRAQHEHATT